MSHKSSDGRQHARGRIILAITFDHLTHSLPGRRLGRRQQGRRGRSDLHAVFEQQQVPPALARIHDQFLPPGQHLFHGLQVQPQLVGPGRRAEGLLLLDEARSVARGAVRRGRACRRRRSATRLRVAARQRHLLVAIALGLVDQAVLLLVRAGHLAEGVHHFERRMHVLQLDAQDAHAQAGSGPRAAADLAARVSSIACRPVVSMSSSGVRVGDRPAARIRPPRARWYRRRARGTGKSSGRSRL